MNRKPLPYHPQMWNGGLPPAHLPSSPHSNPVATIANIKAIVSDVIAASAKKAIARRHEANAWEKVLANEANKRRRHEAARALQEVAATCACQEVAAACACCQQLLNEHAAHARQKAAATCACQEATRRQQLLDKQAARARQEAAAAHDRQKAARQEASRVISLWLRRQRRFARLTHEANEQHRHESAERNTTTASAALAKDEYNDVAGQLEAYAATLFACVDNIMAEIQAMDDGFGNQAAAGEKALADKADKLRQAAAREKAFANEANKLHQAAAREKALANEANKLRQAAMREKALVEEANEQRRANAREKACSDEANERRQAAMRKKVLANEVNKQHCRPSTTVDGQPQTACRRSRPRLRVGCRHGPQAPNPHEHLPCGR
jgi:hypothetical protein